MTGAARPRFVSTIVVGITNAPTAHAAAQRAVELAEITGATVHFVTAVAKSQHGIIESAGDVLEFDTLDDAHETTEAFVRSLGTSIAYTITAVEGSAGRVIIDAAEQHRADLIVVGNVGMHGLGRLLGSVGNDIVHHAPCSVLVVKTD